MSVAATGRNLLRAAVAPEQTSVVGSVLRSIGYGTLIAVLAIIVKHAVSGPLGHDGPFLLMLGSMVAAGWYGGPVAALVAAVLGTAAVNYFFLPPYYDWHSTREAHVQTALFGAEALLVVGLTSMLGIARRRAEEATARVRCLYAVSSALGSARTNHDVAASVVSEGASALGASGAALFLVDRSRTAIEIVAHKDMPHDLVDRLRHIPIDGGLPVATVVRTGAVLAASNQEQLRAAFPEIFGDPSWHPPRSLLCVPVRSNGLAIGVLGFGFDREREFTPDDRSLVLTLAHDCACALERARVFDAEHRAHLEAEEASRAKDQFLAVVSHELRSPLTAIGGWVHLLRRRLGADPESVRGLEVIDRNTQVEARLIEDLIDLSRLGCRRLDVRRDGVDLAAVARTVGEELIPVASSKGLGLCVSADGAVPVVGDADRLAQVTRNLVWNAIRYTPEGGHVVVQVRGGERACLRVEDDGVGIPPEELPRVFELFRRGEPSTVRRDGGLGVGLTIVRGLVEAHGGTVRIESAGRGRGTTAIVELPPIAARVTV